MDNNCVAQEVDNKYCVTPVKQLWSLGDLGRYEPASRGLNVIAAEVLAE